jgi:hypothetical protein
MLCVNFSSDNKEFQTYVIINKGLLGERKQRKVFFISRNVYKNPPEIQPIKKTIIDNRANRYWRSVPFHSVFIENNCDNSIPKSVNSPVKWVVLTVEFDILLLEHSYPIQKHRTCN